MYTFFTRFTIKYDFPHFLLKPIRGNGTDSTFTEKAYWIEDEIGNLEMMEKVEFLCVHYNGEELAALNGMLGDMGDEEQAERIAAEVTRIKAEQDAKWVKS